MSIVFIRAIILYIIVIFSVRLMGKRQIGELQPSELAITILVSNIATLPLEDLDIPLIMGILPILSLICFEVLMSWITLKSKRIRRIVTGCPKIIIRNGNVEQKVLKDLRFSVDDLMTALRVNGVFDISDVQFAIAETNGNISVYEKQECQAVKNSDMKIKTKNSDPPSVIISDGKVDTQGFRETGLESKWLTNIMEKNQINISDVFLLTADKNGKYNMIKKEK